MLPAGVSISAAADLREVKALLTAAGLPTQDIRPDGVFLVARAGSELCGTAGIEAYGSVALLRSVAVDPRWRRRGVARALCDEIVDHARRSGVHRLFLLTTDAQAFFRRCGFGLIDRDALPAEVRATAQFRELCPQTASAMAREL